MLHYLSCFIEPEDVDACVFQPARPDLVAVKHDVVAFDDGAFHFHSLAGVLGGHAFEIFNKPVLAVADMRIVLNVFVTR